MRVPASFLLPFVLAVASAAQARADDVAFFESRIRPVLSKSCFKCHGSEKTSQGLNVDSRLALLQGGESGPVVVPGQPDASLLIQAISHSSDELSMPPDEPLPPQVVADFRRWIQEGAVWPENAKLQKGRPHWAFEPPQKIDPPTAIGQWSDHPIDRFVALAWRKHNLTPVPGASTRVLLRRVYYDLTGLPPTPQEIQAFERDSSRDPDAAFCSLVDRLLDSPAYGERWGRHWMDVARYADTAGDNADYPIPEARRYRDYVIDAFNADLPYDQFVREQLAGDILARNDPTDRYAQQVIATGYLALSRRYGTAPYELWHLTLEDTIDTVGRSLLGLTLKCARCHDHKFDPVTTQDYYALYGIFESTQFPWAGAEEFHSKKTHRLHFVPTVPDAQAAPIQAAFQVSVDELAARINKLDEQLQKADEQDKPALQEQIDPLRAEHFQMQRSGLPADLPGAYSVSEGKPHDARIQVSGEPQDPGEVAARGAIKFLSNEPLNIPPGQSGRLQLARWITRPDHPLTARVMVNRIWLHHFGSGIVATPSNFGTSGAEPTHPQLLDYLAGQFVKSGWSVKHLHRLILTSKTWQLSSDARPHNSLVDTGNKYYWRHDRRRLDAEAIRDTMLSVSGQLNRNAAPAHPFPPMKDWHWTQHDPFKDRYDWPHRSVYLMTQRIQRHPFLALFDGPDTNTTTGRRTSSIVTPQSLYLMNSPEMLCIARAFAGRLMAGASNPLERIDLAYRLCYARLPTDSERARDAKYIDRFQSELKTEHTAGANPDHAAWTSLARIWLSSSECFYLD